MLITAFKALSLTSQGRDKLMATHTTTKLALRYPDLAQSPADVPDWLQKLAEDVDSTCSGFSKGLFSARPSASRSGWFYYATDTNTLYMDDSSVWHVVGSQNRVGVLADIPAATTVAVGTKYFATDQVSEFVSDGANWIRVSEPAGKVSLCLAATADAGHILLKGQAWPDTTGIYAAIYARFGNPSTVPDMQGYVPVGYKSGDGSFGTLLATLGEKTHALTGAENGAHVHGTLTAGDSFQVGHAASGPLNSIGPGPANLDSSTLDSTTASAGSGTPHNNIQPSIVVNFQAKL